MGKARKCIFHHLKAKNEPVCFFVCLFFHNTAASLRGALPPSPAGLSPGPLAQWRAHFHQSYHCFHSRTSKDSSPGQRPPSSHTISLNYNQCLVYVIIFRACLAMYAASTPTEITALSLRPEPDLVISAPSSRVSVEVSKNKHLLVA